jgi:nucleotide-binding universal stress UspA family protein
MEKAPALFERIVCGIDETPQSLLALAQAERLRAPGGRLLLVTVADVSIAVHAGWAATRVFDEITAGAYDAAARATEYIPDAGSRVLEGNPTRCLLEEITRERATLVAVGSHGRGRTAGILLGTSATTLLHEAPCAVLLARPSLTADGFPSSIVVGIDGSQRSLLALAAARAVAERFSSSLRVIAARGGKGIFVDRLREISDLEWDERRPVHALVAAAEDADLLVVGNRGLHGLAAVGSVSERVAHAARSSVLVVRDA